MRRKPIVRRRRADDDIEMVVAHYLNEAGAQIAIDFVNQLEDALNKISKQPAVGSPRYGQIVGIPELRHWSLRKFPYLIFYIEKETNIELLRVLHGKMNIPAWLDNSD